MQTKYPGGARKRPSSALWGLGFIALGLALIIGLAITLSQTNEKGEVKLISDDGIEKDLTADDAVEQTEVKKLPSKLNLQELAENWVKSSSGRTSVYIYDLDHNEAIAKVNETADYRTASLYKLFPVYEGYARVYRGEWRANTALAGRTIWECLDAAIRSSDSPCAESLWNLIGVKEMDNIIKDNYAISHTYLSSYISDPVDIAEILKRFYYHPDFDTETYQTFLQTMQIQPPVNNGLCDNTPCNWRQGLPAGLESDRVFVYNKVGWEYGNNNWTLYHDAAIVTTNNRHLIVVVMAANINSFAEITNFGTQLRQVLEAN